jgi:hypothetical protein
MCARYLLPSVRSAAAYSKDWKSYLCGLQLKGFAERDEQVLETVLDLVEFFVDV